MAQTQLIAGRFQQGREIGVGGMGTVYLGTDTQTGEQVAIKVLKPDIVRDAPSLLERFEREGDALRRLNHPTIVKVLGTVEENGNHYIILEYVQGGSLRDYRSK
ncbi:MAG: protein kinase, partial [Chloroflexota bacterium]